jgi:hypothetical protein
MERHREGKGKRPARSELVSVDDSIDDIAAKALQAARDAEKRAKRKKEADSGKVENPSIVPRTTPTPEKKLSE